MPEFFSFLSLLWALVLSHPAVAIVFAVWIWGLLSKGRRKPKATLTSMPTVSPVRPLSVPQTLGGPQTARPQQPLAEALPAAAKPQQTFAEQAVERIRREFTAKPGPPKGQTASSTQSSAAIQQLRAESDKQAQAALNTAAAAEVVSNAAIAAAAAKPRGGLVEMLGDGDPNRGALIAAIVLSQALERRKPRR